MTGLKVEEVNVHVQGVNTDAIVNQEQEENQNEENNEKNEE